MKPKKFSLLALLAYGLICELAPSADRPLIVSPIKLIANPVRYDKKVIVVIGYLWMASQRHDLSSANIYLHKEDFENSLPNGIAVIPSEQMLRDQEKINGKYVVLIGTFHMTPVAGVDPLADGALTIKDVSSCVQWSDPNNPISLQGRRSK